MGMENQRSEYNDKCSSLKTNLVIWHIYATEAYDQHMRTEFATCRNLNVESMLLDVLDAKHLLNLSAPDLIFIETAEGWAKKVIELQGYELPSGDHESSLIALGDENNNEALKTALRLGASDFLSDRVMIDEMMPMLKRTAEEKVANRNLGELCLFINTKGGSGATTLALNTAIDIASTNPNNVLLLDIDMQFGVIAEYLNITPKYSITDAISSVRDLDEVSLSGFVSKHSSGLHILSFRHEDGNDEYEKAKKLSKLLPLLRQFYSYIIVDLSRGIDHVFSPIFSPATHLFLVMQQSLVSISNTTRIIRNLKYDYGVTSEQIELVVNRYEKRQSIKLSDIEKAIPGVNYYLIPNDFKVVIESANLGTPFVEVKKRSAITKSIQELSHSFAPLQNEPTGWFGKLFS
ncbi:AAA family ATPase [Aliivibrio sp. EL58]|uniref:AAA family ATPase n=1 Tax=Aliivibrio sp. EL58 TaxID=2107582 RepID=UPI000EFCC029|nr:AAA family ATPase [Aliivibrio sp. EL58]